MGSGRDIFESMYGCDRPTAPRVEWHRIGALFLPYWRAQFVVLGCIVLSAILGLVPGYAAALVIDKALPQKDFQALAIAVGAMAAAALLSMGVGVLQGFYSTSISEGIMRDIRSRLVAHLFRVPLSFFTETKSGEIMNRVLSDVDNIDSVLANTLTTVVTSIVIIFTTLVAMFVWNWRLALISTIVVPLMVLPLRSVGRRMYERRKKTREQRDTIQAIAQETLSLSGITLVKAFAREDFEESRFFDVSSRLMKFEIDLAMAGRWFMGAVSSMVLIGPGIIWLGGGWLALRNALDVGVIVAFISYLQGRLYGPAASLVGVQAQVVSALAVFERIFSYLDLPTEHYDSPGAVAFERVRGDIAFENVSFGYGARSVLSNVTFQIDAGQVAAFVGPSGAGKSTIANLVPRFCDVDNGRVLIDTHNVRDIALTSLRRDIGIVTQESYLFHDTIANNLRYAKPGATDAELIAAANLAKIHEFIAALPHGYETVVGERGHKLSGGERQRLAIARVLLKNPRILIFDEATSALDAHNEAAVQSALEVAMRGRTSLVIAHRLSTIVSADVIFVIENGRIVESGNHEELLAHEGLYASLYSSRFREASPPVPC